MSERDLKIVSAAFRLFAHYGVGKTSMAEIATESGVARQTVYNAFDGKEDLVFAALLHYAGKSRADVERDCNGVIDLPSRLEVLFRHLVEFPFEAMQRLPHLDEILEVGEGLDEERRKEIRETYVGAIRMVLAPHERDFEQHGIALESLATLLKGVLTTIKREARDESHLRDLFEPAKALIVGCARERATCPR
ncbi:MAG: TetR/AcrR family transcriptional regulator [Boseongicola sp.]|nr:TetR/AcrR family transcriptional regulator [Boseongicola sp.]